MFFKDLTFYEYYLPFRLSNVFNIGWLDGSSEFTKGATSRGLVEKLSEILVGENCFLSRVNQIRGVHSCNICNAQKFDLPFLGSCEIWIPSCENGAYFAAPSLVIHYIQEHSYCPPEIFVESVMEVDITRNFNGQELYDGLVRSYSSEK